ncbi:MAG: methyltransferase, TrmH family, group 2 [Chthoniobacteraceae bacterium]|nr:methyltransferase, TrmH family, group 2 [Chthoniobacteraceae bacterium]
MGKGGCKQTNPLLPCKVRIERAIALSAIARAGLFLVNAPFSMFHIVLIEPEIPPNTGNVGRLCLATGAHLHLVKPLGFLIDDRTLLRAGLDYWKEVQVALWDSFDALRAAQAADARFFFLTTKSTRAFWDTPFQDGDFLVFGRETKGLPESLLSANQDRCLTIPMTNQTRSLNLANSVAIVLFEAIRQARPAA